MDAETQNPDKPVTLQTLHVLARSCMVTEGWRLGQAYFNVLETLRPELVTVVRGNPYLDPYYDDSLLPYFLIWVEAALE